MLNFRYTFTDCPLVCILVFNPLPTNDAMYVMVSIGIYIGELILGVILQYMVSASFSCFLWSVTG